MQTLRHFTLLTRLVLGWFVLSLGIAFAAPLVKPVGMMEVCSASGAVLQIADNNDPGAAKGHTLECSFCLPFAAPAPDLFRAELHGVLPSGGNLLVPCRPVPVRSASSQDARGPPTVA
jgi:hypothetical protein